MQYSPQLVKPLDQVINNNLTPERHSLPQPIGQPVMAPFFNAQPVAGAEIVDDLLSDLALVGLDKQYKGSSQPNTATLFSPHHHLNKLRANPSAHNKQKDVDAAERKRKQEELERRKSLLRKGP